VFRATVELAKNFDLIGGKLLAGDGTKLRAQNSKKNNYNQAKIDRHLAYIETKLGEYNAVLASEDGDVEQKLKAKQKIEQHLLHQQKYKDLEKQLEETGEAQISTSDPESRQLIIRNVITEVAYNVQSTVDEKHNIPINYEVTNENDLCTKAANKRGRVIERLIYAHLLEKNKKRVRENYEIYKKRQAIVEHPFGIIKRQWDFYYIVTKKGKERASADVGLIFTAFNLRRIFNLLNQNALKKYLRELDLNFSYYIKHLDAFYGSLFSYLTIGVFKKEYSKVA